MKKITIQDVAKELNLSRNTVAKALSNSETVAYETRFVVIKKAYEMGYSKLSPVVLNEFKVKDKLVQSKTIVVIARRELSTFWNRIIMGISDELNKNNCKLQFNFISEEDEINHTIPTDLHRDISGIIILSVFGRSYLEKVVTKDIPVVFLDGPSNIHELSDLGDILVFEGENSTKELTKDLIKKGMRRIGFIGDITYCRSLLERYEGYRKALEEYHIPLEKEIVVTDHVTNRYYKMNEISNAVSKMTSLPDAFVCANDDIAKDLISILNNRGLKVPKDIAVTGFDNKDGGENHVPSLTTVHIGNQRMGRRLVQILMWRMENMDLPNEIITVKTEPIYRESSNRKI